MAEPSADSLSLLRQQMRHARRTLDRATQKHHAQALAKMVCRSRPFINSKTIACYLANDGEIDPRFILERAWLMHKQVYLPVLSPLGHRLYFAPHSPGGPMSANRFGIMEPDCHPREWRNARQLDVIFLPLVAFDTAGNRAGMGGGFYDRSLAYRQHRQLWQRPALYGLAHELQKTDQLSVRSWDIPLDGIATEQCIYTISG
ncbi:MAG: 5-formyltetrahydrofolate cyclo-ligase [Gammaproteobacteria bacterium]